MTEFRLSDYIEKIGMRMAEEEQNKILKKYGLIDLNKNQIQGVADLISYVKKCYDDTVKNDVKEFIKKRNGLLQEYLDGKIPLIIFLERIDKLTGDELI